MNNEESVDEAERRRKVVDEKIWGAMIEHVERMRKQPTARSIVFRLFYLAQNAYACRKVMANFLGKIDPNRPGVLETPVPQFTAKQVNFLIKTYNSIIKDIHSNLAKRDAYVTEFSSFEELDEPTIVDITMSLLAMETSAMQIISYLTRWIK